MKVLVSPRQSVVRGSEELGGPEALIEEARERQRHRHLRVIAVFLVAAAGVTVGIKLAGGSGGAAKTRTTAPKSHAAANPTTRMSTRSSSGAPTPCGSQPQLSMVNADDGWLTMGNGTILGTRDSGRTWRTSYDGPACVGTFDFVDALHGWAVTQSDLLTTADGGARWTSIPEPAGFNLNTVYFVTPTIGWAITTDGHLLHTGDGGEIWRSADAPDQAGTVCADSDGTWVALTDGDVYGQVPGTSTWHQSLLFSQVPAPDAGFTATRQVDPTGLACSGKTVWAFFSWGCGAGNCWRQIERSLDGGATWTLTHPQLTSYLSLGGATSPTGAWFPAGGGDDQPPLLETTNDAGSTFHILRYPQSGALPTDVYAVDFVTSDQGWAVIANVANSGPEQADFIHTDDEGNSWHLVSLIPGS